MKVSYFSKKKWPEKTESFRIKFLKEQEIYNTILKQVEKYLRENLNTEGFRKNAKISGEITDINIKKN